MLAQFYDEVLFYGPTAVLPQNLSSKWLRRLQEISDDFLDSNFRLDECKEPEDIGNSVVVTDIKMPFGSMVVFMVKWAIATIPALIILTVIGSITLGILSAIYGGFHLKIGM